MCDFTLVKKYFKNNIFFIVVTRKIFVHDMLWKTYYCSSRIICIVYLHYSIILVKQNWFFIIGYVKIIFFILNIFFYCFAFVLQIPIVFSIIFVLFLKMLDFILTFFSFLPKPSIRTCVFLMAAFFSFSHCKCNR